MSAAVLPDYSSVIISEIEQVVSRIAPQIKPPFPFYLRVKIGYLLAHHHGQQIIKSGDVICGLPVEVVQTADRFVKVCCYYDSYRIEADDYSQISYF